MFIRFDVIHERDRQTDGHRVTAKTVLMHRIARQKLEWWLLDDEQKLKLRLLVLNTMHERDRQQDGQTDTAR